MKFTDLDLDDSVLDALDYMHYGDCTPVQEKAIPPVLAGDDVIAVAQTGTGKTAAYLLPILSNLNRYRYPEDAINCVIMAPTRELAQQIDQQMQGFSYFVDASSVAIYGGGEGRDFDIQKKGLVHGADVVIATPGRLLSHLNLGYVDLSKVAFFVLDEADRMLDMGFYDDIMTIAKCLPQDCQKILYSATMPPKTQKLAEAIMYKPVMVKIAISKPAEKIHQQACICYEPQKVHMLIRYLKRFFGGGGVSDRSALKEGETTSKDYLYDGFVKEELLQNPEKRVVIFVSRKLNVKDVVLQLRKKGFKVAAMHSDLEQKEREEVMNAFKAGRTNVLVATDIVSRGIDINGIELVINFDLPHDPEDYVHRIGRTARADRDGESLTFVNYSDRIQMRKFKELEKFIEKQMDRIPVPEDLGGCEYKESYDQKTKGPHKSKFKSGKDARNKKNDHNQPKEHSERKESHRTDGTPHRRRSARKSAESSTSTPSPVDNTPA